MIAALLPALAAATIVVLEVPSGRVLSEEGAVHQSAPTGSAIKPFVLEAAGSEGARFEQVCRRTLRLNGRRMDCHHPRLARPLRAAEALAYSCNSFFAALALRVDPSRLAAVLREFGFTVGASPRTEAERQLQALGEFGVAISPLELARAYARLLGRHPQGVAGLREAVEAGTGQLAAIDGGVTVAGKTGTTKGHAWFAGYAPAEKPGVVIVVRTAEGTGGASAAPVAAEVLKRWFAARR